MADPLAEAQELWFSTDLFFSGILGELLDGESHEGKCHFFLIFVDLLH